MLKRITLFFTMLACCVALAAKAQTPAVAPAKVHHVLFAVTSSDEADWGLTIGNIRNLIADLQPDTVEIEVVAYGPGLKMVLKTSADAAAIQALQSPHVRFVACQNAMRHQNVTEADLLPGVGQVPAGIGEVVRKQEQGWVYIKGGR